MDAPDSILPSLMPRGVLDYYLAYLLSASLVLNSPGLALSLEAPLPWLS